MAEKIRKKSSGGKQGRQVVARQTKPSRVRRRAKLGFPAKRGKIRVRGARKSVEGVITSAGMDRRVLSGEKT